MGIETLLVLLLIIFVGAYFQTVTGFGLGIIVIGLTKAYQLTTIDVIAVVVSFVTLVNCGLALSKDRKGLNWPLVKYAILGIPLGIISGVYLLDHLTTSFTHLLQALLGIIIIYSGVSFFVKPNKQASPSGKPSFVVSGFASGLTGGLFGMAGPPVIYHFYRQPIEVSAVRNMLLLVFACTSATRTTVVMVQDKLDYPIIFLSLMAVPTVAFATYLGHRLPPPVTGTVMKKIVFVVLILLGLYLLLGAIYSYYG